MATTTTATPTATPCGGNTSSPNSCSSATAGAEAAALPCCQHETVIEFRPLRTWQGEFGFDWMRVYEGASGRIGGNIPGWEFAHLGGDEKPYIDGASGAARDYPKPPYKVMEPTDPPPVAGEGIVIGGYKSPLEQMSPAEAREKIRGEYMRRDINRPQPLSYRLGTYFVPYLNLFPEKDANGAPLGGQEVPSNPRLALSFSAPPSSTPAPPPPAPALRPPVRRCEAELQVLYDIKNEKPGKIAIEYDPKLFAITGSGASRPKAGSQGVYEYIIPASKYRITPSTYQDSVKVAEVIKIKCLREINVPYHALHVRAYPVVNPRPGDKGTIVGMLNVCGNNASYRKEVKIALVKVITDIGQTTNLATGKFDVDEVGALYHTLHQALITPDIINKDEHGNDYILDLTAAPKFHLASDSDGFIVPAPPPIPGMTNAIPGMVNHGAGFGSYLVAAFNQQLRAKGLNAVADRFLIFAFDEKAAGNISGFALSKEVLEKITNPAGNEVSVIRTIWLPGMALFKGRDRKTLTHEQLHTFTMHHTHSDWGGGNPIPPDSITPNCKYIFPQQATTNILAYGGNSRCSTWHWQWKIMRDNVDVDWNGKKE
jgi:hypothetical protein